eukprot:TRINITY_DN19027_c0_g2_i2.p1 TRINITY_DN19027_c0_g2~~TRINITY_DN19027_c0_g2_i2.p1  ORF type:complete len:336 (+),score=33.37 TRINITY_DN19027_c0_g2_i2:75-1082(+)
MAADAAAQLPDSAGAPAAAGGTAAGAGMAVFVRVPGLPDALCVELPSDATVADLRRGAQELAGRHQIVRLRYAGELLADESAALADAGIGPQAMVDAGGVRTLLDCHQHTMLAVVLSTAATTTAGLSLTFVERHRVCDGGDSYCIVRAVVPVSELEGLRVTGEAPPCAHKFFDPHIPEGEAPLWVANASAELLARDIKPDMQFRLVQAGFGSSSLLNTQDPEQANMDLQRILADSEFQRGFVKCHAQSVPPAVTIEVDPEATLEQALLQVAEQQGFKLMGEYHFFIMHAAARDRLGRTTRCGVASTMLPEGACLEWQASLRTLVEMIHLDDSSSS